MTRHTVTLLLGLSLIACSTGGEVTRKPPVQTPNIEVSSIGPHAFDGGSIAERDDSCQQADAIACLIVGDSLRHGTTKTKVDVAQARAHYELACEYGNPTGCAALATHLMTYDLPTTPQTSARIQKLLKRACEDDEPSACKTLADLYAEDDLQAATYTERAAQQRAQACTSGDVVRCHLTSLAHGDSSQLDTLCAAGYAPSCLAILTLATDDAPHTAATWRARRKPLERLCEDSGVTAACLELGQTYSDEELAQDELAQKLYFALSRAQQRGDKRAYRELGDYYERVGKAEMARTSYRTGCEEGLVMSCNALINILMLDSSAEGTLLMKTYLRACDLGDQLSCTEAARAYETGDYGTKVDKEKAIELYGRTCQEPRPFERGCKARDRLRAESP